MRRSGTKICAVSRMSRRCWRLLFPTGTRCPVLGRIVRMGGSSTLFLRLVPLHKPKASALTLVPKVFKPQLRPAEADTVHSAPNVLRPSPTHQSRPTPPNSFLPQLPLSNHSLQMDIGVTRQGPDTSINVPRPSPSLISVSPEVLHPLGSCAVQLQMESRVHHGTQLIEI